MVGEKRRGRARGGHRSGQQSPASGRVPRQARRRRADGDGLHGVPAQRRRTRAELPPAAPSDGDLIALLQVGDTSAYDELYRRHAESVRRYARTCCRDAHTADDLTNEVFARTLLAVRRGSGPRRDTPAVRAYLLTSVRRVAAAWARTTRREHLVEDFAVFAESAAGRGPGSEDAPEEGADVRAMREAERSLVVKAFLGLPEKYRTVLWHTAVEGESPKEVAPLLGMTDNAAAVLAHRAREKLRQAYLQAHVSTSLTAGGECALYAERLGAYARGALRTRAEFGLRQHMAGCARCRVAAAEVRHLNERLRSLVPLALVGWFAAGGATTLFAVAAGGGAAGAGAAAASVGAASEGVGAPVKAGVAAGVLTSAVVAVVLVLVAGGGTPPPEAQARPSAAPVQSAPPSAPPSARTPSHHPPPAARAAPTPPGTTPRPTPRREEPVQAVSRSEPVTASGRPGPPATTSVSPPPAVFPLHTLAWSPFARRAGEPKAPTLRGGGPSGVWRRDGPRVGGRGYAHGVTVAAPSSVTVDLHRECAAFDALVGVDDLALRTGTVVFSVYVDGKRLWSSVPLRGGRAAVPVHVPLEGAASLRLTTRPRGLLGVTAASDWVSARISCR